MYIRTSRRALSPRPSADGYAGLDKSDLENRPQPTAGETAAIADSTARVAARRRPVALSCAVAGNKLQIASPHTHEGGFEMHLLDAFGTVSRAFAEESLLDLVNAVRSRGSKSPTEQEIKAALAALDGVRPRDETEATLSVQMVATHRAALDVLARARHAEHVPTANDCGNLAVKLLRIYAMQAETLAKLRRGGEQTVRVEHVHVHSGGQAIVGPVTHQAPVLAT